jgi:hypothetical protein
MECPLSLSDDEHAFVEYGYSKNRLLPAQELALFRNMPAMAGIGTFAFRHADCCVRRVSSREL